MPIITLTTIIHAPQKCVFNLSRSVDLHQISASHTNEKAIDGTLSGLMNLNDCVTWRAKHLGITQNITVQITDLQPYSRFTDEMTKGIFQAFKHQHIFESINESKTKMIDIFNYTSPLGIIGKFVDHLFLKAYMKQFLIQRNIIIKQFAESNQWKSILQKP